MVWVLVSGGFGGTQNKCSIIEDTERQEQPSGMTMMIAMLMLLLLLLFSEESLWMQRTWDGMGYGVREHQSVEQLHNIIIHSPTTVSRRELN